VETQYSADNKCNMPNRTERKDGSLGGSMVKMQHLNVTQNRVKDFRIGTTQQNCTMCSILWGGVWHKIQ